MAVEKHGQLAPGEFVPGMDVSVLEAASPGVLAAGVVYSYTPSCTGGILRLDKSTLTGLFLCLLVGFYGRNYLQRQNL